MKSLRIITRFSLFCGLASLLVAGNALAEQPNILLITADDLSWESVGVYGCPVEDTTPNIDRLASEGIQFDYGYVQIYIYNPWVDGVTEVHNSDYTGSPTLLAMWKAAESVPSIKKRTNFHKYRIREELYNVRQNPHAYINVAPAPESRVRIAEMQAILVNWMEETDHPALDLMKDPHNEQLISEYMEWERLNAVKQVEEVKRGKR